MSPTALAAVASLPFPAAALPVPSPREAVRSGPAPGPERFNLELPLPMRHAGLRRVTVRGQWLGPEGAPVLLVAGGISANRRVADGPDGPGWWPKQVGPARAIDTTRRRVLTLDWLGADGSLDAPIDPADQADAIALVLGHFGTGPLQAFVGASYGAMVGLQFAARHPARLQRLVAISGAHRPHPYASAWRALQRQVLALGRDQASLPRALSLARQCAMLSYRTPEEFARRFDAAAELHEQRARVAAEPYLAHCGDQYAARWCATAFLRLSESIDLQRLDPATVSTPTTVVAVAEDRLVPLADLQALVEGLGGPARLQLLRSEFGHDAFLTEHAAIARCLRRALGETA